MMASVTYVLLLVCLMFKASCDASPIGFLEDTNSSDYNTPNESENTEDPLDAYLYETNAYNNPEDFTAPDLLTEGNDRDFDSSIVVPDFDDLDTPMLMESPELSNDEPEEAVNAEINAKLVAFLKNPKATGMLDLLKNLFHSYREKLSEDPYYAEINEKIKEFLLNPKQKDLDILDVMKNVLNIDKGSDDSDTPLVSTNTANLVTHSKVRKSIQQQEPSAEEQEDSTEQEEDSAEHQEEDSTEQEEDSAEQEEDSAEQQQQDSAEQDEDSAEQQEDSTKQLHFPEGIANALGFLVDPTVPKALNATAKLNGLESEEKNKTNTRTDGFEFLNMASHFQRTKGLRKKHLVKRMKKDLDIFLGRSEKLTDIVKTLLAYVGSETTREPELLFSIISDVGQGQVNALFVYYKRRPDGKYNLRILKFNGKVKLAATLVITRVSTDDESESQDVISYLPRENTTEKEVTELLDIMVPELGKLLSNISSEDKS